MILIMIFWYGRCVTIMLEHFIDGDPSNFVIDYIIIQTQFELFQLCTILAQVLVKLKFLEKYI